jgi:hypothetical protein
MDTILLEIAKNGGPSAIIVCIGYLILNGKIDSIVKSLDKLCLLRHAEVDRRIERLEKITDEE